MTIQELATAAERRLQILVLVIDNGMYGTIRMHQERHFPARVSGTSINNPDFSKVAAGYGWHVEKVIQTEAFEPALAASQEHCGPSLIHVMLDPEAITPTKTLSDIRADLKLTDGNIVRSTIANRSAKITLGVDQEHTGCVIDIISIGWVVAVIALFIGDRPGVSQGPYFVWLACDPRNPVRKIGHIAIQDFWIIALRINGDKKAF